MLASLTTQISYEIRIHLRQAFSWLTPLLFFIIVTCLFPLAIGSDQALLKKIAPGILWVAALLSVLLSLNSLFKSESQEGALDLLLLSPTPLTLLVSAKIISHWLIYCLPLILISPVLGFLLHLRPHEELALILTLLLGTPVLSMLGAIGAALTIGIRGHGLLLPVLIMPLYVPILIFGTGTLLAASMGQPIQGYIAIIGALLLLCAGFAPWMTAIALRIGAAQ